MEVAQETPTMDIPTSTHSSARRGESMSLDGNTNAKPAPVMTKDGAAAVSAGADAFNPDATRKLSVLLVEDDHATLVFVKALLKSCGHTVTTASNGKEAIDALLAPDQDVDLILTDIMMPEVDGMELMRIVQSSDKPFRSIPIIVMSTVDSDDFMTKCQEAGAQDYLVKPVKKSQMIDLGRHAQSSGLSTGEDGMETAAGGCDSVFDADEDKEGVSAREPREATATTGNNNSNASTETGAHGIRGSSPEENAGEATTAAPSRVAVAAAEAARNAAEDGDHAAAATAAAAGSRGSAKRSSRIAVKMAQQESEAVAAAEAAKQAKAQAKAKATAKSAAAGDADGHAAGGVSIGRKKTSPSKAPASAAPGGEGKQGQSGMEKWASGASGGSAGTSQNLSGSGCGSGGSGSGSGSGEEPNVVGGLSVQLVTAYGGATTILELSLPRPQTSGEEAPNIGLRRSASRSAFHSFLNLEDAAAVQVISLKIAPEVAAHAEESLDRPAGTAAAAEGTGYGGSSLDVERQKQQHQHQHQHQHQRQHWQMAPVAQVQQLPSGPSGSGAAVGALGAPYDEKAPPPHPNMAAFFSHMAPHDAAAAAAGMPVPPPSRDSVNMFQRGIPGMPPSMLGLSDAQPLAPALGGSGPGGSADPNAASGHQLQQTPTGMPAPGPGVFPPCPHGVEPSWYAQHMAAAASAASAAASQVGPVGSAAASAEFVSRFYSVLQSAVEHQQKTFMRLGATATCAERRAEAIARFLKKRKERNFEKKVRYASRKRLAEARPRVRGQFVRLKDESGGDGEGEGSGGDGSNDGGSNGGSKENSASPARRGEDEEEAEDDADDE